MRPAVASLDHLVLTVADIPRAVAFYRDVPGMTPVEFDTPTGPRHALSFGGQKINLHAAGAEFDPKAARPTPGSADLCFLTGMPVADWNAHLSAAGLALEDGPVRRTGATGPILSLYLRDPDGNLLELANPV